MDASSLAAREQSLAAFHESLEALRRAIRTEQEDTITGIIERLEPLRQGIEERQESLSWAAKRLADDKLAAVERQQRHVEQLLEGVRRGDASSDALSYPLVPCTDSNFLCLPEVAEAAAGIQTLGSACGRFFELAMEGGTAEAHHWLGIRYQTGDGVPQDLAKAVRHFEISAAAGSVDAQFSLACRFLNGEGTARSLTEGLRLLTRAADSGHPDAQNALATRYFTGNGVARNVPTAIKYFRMAADGLQRVAAYNLATCYYNGDGVEQNYALAVQYYRQAADAGLPKAQLLLAELYEAGEGVAQDIDMALRYWQMAADQGEPDAQNAYAETIIQQYPESPENWGEASNYLAMAAEQGHCDAQYNLAEVLLTTKQHQPDCLANAARWFSRAADQGHVLATHNLAVCYKHGQGVREDQELASRHFEAAADAGHAAAQYALAWRRYKGQGCQHDLEEAKRLFTLAADQGHEQASKAAQQFTELTQLFHSASASRTSSGVEEGEPPVSATKPTVGVSDEEEGAEDEEADVLALLQMSSDEEEENTQPQPEEEKDLRGLSDRGEYEDSMLQFLQDQREEAAERQAEEQEELLATVVGQDADEEEQSPTKNGHAEPTGDLNAVNDNREDALGELLAGVVNSEPEPEPEGAEMSADELSALAEADLAAWGQLKDLGWGKQLGALVPQGWEEPPPDYDEADTLVGSRIFVIEHGFGVLVKATKKKRGWAPASVDFRDGGKKMVILRLKGKEMGSPFLIAPTQPVPTAPKVEAAKSRPEPEPEPDAAPASSDAAGETAQWESIKSQPWGQQLKALTECGWVEASTEYDEIDGLVGQTVFVMEQGPGELVKVAKKKRGWGPCSLRFHGSEDKTMVILRLKGKGMGTPWLYKGPDWALPSSSSADADEEQDLIASLMGGDSSSDDGEDLGALITSLEIEDDQSVEDDPVRKVALAKERTATFQAFSGKAAARYLALKTPRDGMTAAAEEEKAKKNRKRAKAVYGKHVARDGEMDDYVLPVHAKDFTDTGFLQSKLKELDIFDHLKDEQRNDLVDTMQELRVQANECLVRQGDSGNTCYIIESGKFDCVKKMSRKEFCGIDTKQLKRLMGEFAPDGNFDELGFEDILNALQLQMTEGNQSAAYRSMADGKAHASHADFTRWFCKTMVDFHVLELGAGSYFGELALLYDAPRQATVVASEDSKVWTIDIDAFKYVVVNGNSKRTAELKKTIKRVEQFSSLGPDDLQNMADALSTTEFEDGEAIITQDEPCDDSSLFYIIDSGKASVKVRQGGSMNQVAMLERGKCFGERAILDDKPRNATIEAVGPVTCLTLSRQDFNRVLGDLKHLLEKVHTGSAAGGRDSGRSAGGGRASPSIGSSSVTFDPSLREVDFDGMALSHADFTHGGVLGKGSFGLVTHVRAKGGKHPGKYYAMKAMSKQSLMEMEQVSHIMNEKKVMNLCFHPLVVNLHGCFQDDASLYMVMEYIKGGELYSVMNKQGTLNDEQARFYAAEIMEALVFLHSNSIAYRDLKPENVLLDGTGHVKITDFGFATPIPEGEKTYTVCGTPDYISPEIIQQAGHSFQADFWALGVTIYEMLTGKTPFATRGGGFATYRKVMKGVFECPDDMSPGAASLIRGLCTKDVSKRLGRLANGADDLRNHPWYTDAQFDWPLLQSLEMPPPFVPDVKGDEDTSCFAVEADSDEEDPSEWQNASQPIDESDQPQFEGF